MYRNAYYNYKSKSIFLRTWNSSGDRIDLEIPYQPYLYVEHDAIKDGVSIFNTSLRKIEFEDSYKRKEFVENSSHKYRFFYNISPDQQFLIDSYFNRIDDKSFSQHPLKIFNIDIETKCNKYSNKHIVQLKNKEGEILTTTVENLLEYDNSEHLIYDEEAKDWIRINGSCYLKQTFPNPDVAAYPILLITVHDSISDTYHTWGEGEYTPKLKNSIYHKCDSEVELLSSFLDFYRDDYPDIITGWNIVGFDIPYLVNRIKSVISEGAMLKMSPVGRIYSTKTNNGFGKFFEKWTILGLSVLDYMMLYKTFSRDKRESYSLNYIGEVELGKGKLEINATNLSLLAYSDWENFVDYNIQDVNIVVDLEEKLKYLQIARLMSYQGCSNFEQALGKVKLVEGAIAIQAKKQDLIIPTFEPNIDGALPGGYVREAVTGLQEAIVSFDANSLYPNTIITLNISPETKVGKIINHPDFNNPEDVAELVLVNRKVHKIPVKKLKQFLTLEKMSLSKANILYSQKNKGIIPQLVDDMYAKRVDAKNRGKVLSKIKKKNAEEKAEEFYLDILQYTIKIFLNSIYGVFANNYCIFADIDAARSITETGQWVVQEAGNLGDKFAKENYGIEKSIIVYGDTDSGYFTIAPILKKLGVNLLDSESNITNEAMKVVNYLDEYLNRNINELAKEQLYTLDSRYVFKREVIADSGTFLMKKNYILHINDEEGKKVDKFKYVGVKVAKSTISKTIKTGIKKVVEVALTTKDEKKTNEAYKQVYEEFKNLNIDEMAFRTAVHNLDNYAKNSSLQKFESGSPVHVKASIAYNILLKQLKIDDKYEGIASDQKIKWFYVKKNPYNLNGIAYTGKYPTEFKLQVDIDTMFVKLMAQELERVYECIGWRIPDLKNEVETNLMDLFSL